MLAPHTDVVVIGAGLAGLAAARELSRSGRKVIVLDKGRGVGGRCATRRVDGQPFDHGVSLAHGRDPEFMTVLDGVPSERIEGWPLRMAGRGRPCHPDLVSVGERKVAFAEGMTALPKHLAAGLDVRLQVTVDELDAHPEGLAIRLDDGGHIVASDIVLAVPAEQALALLPDGAGCAVARTLLGWFSSVPCLALAAGYDLSVAEPDFDLLLADDAHPDGAQGAGIFSLVIHDSAKRTAGGVPIHHHVLVYQASPRWSRARLKDPPIRWAADLLAAAGRRLGEWASRPAWTSHHRWRYARIEGGLGLSAPLVQGVGDRGRLVLAGEAFDTRGGLEGAWRSGVRAARLIDETPLHGTMTS